MLKTVKSGKGSVRLKSSDKSVEEKANKAIEKAKAAKAKAVTDEEKVCFFFLQFLDGYKTCRLSMTFSSRCTSVAPLWLVECFFYQRCSH